MDFVYEIICIVQQFNEVYKKHIQKKRTCNSLASKINLKRDVNIINVSKYTIKTIQINPPKVHFI